MINKIRYCTMMAESLVSKNQNMSFAQAYKQAETNWELHNLMLVETKEDVYYDDEE